MRKILLLAGIGLIGLSSCDSETTEEKYVFKDTTGLHPVQQVTTAPQQNPQQPVSVNATPGQQQMINTATPAVTMSNGQSTTATPPGMNPPHGQPNHRCDIPVGAPLNSKPTQAANVQPMKINMPTTTMTAPNTVTPPGMNPPHGQPNHRCDIAVGAPLNSKPNTPAVTTQPLTSQPAVAQPVANPAAAAPIINDVQGAKQLPVAKKDSGQ